MALTNLPPPTGDAQSVPDNIPVWSRFFHWCFLLWQWVTSTLPRSITFGNGDGTYSAAIQMTAGQSDNGGLTYLGPTPHLRAFNGSQQSVVQGFASITVITNWTTQLDTTGSFVASTGIYTAPIGGTYMITGGLLFTGAAWGAGSVVESHLIVNGTQYASGLAGMTAAGSTDMSSNVSASVVLKQGDTVKLGVINGDSVVVNHALDPASAFTFLSIARVGP